MPADAAPAWLWVPELPDPGEEFTLAGEDAHYVSRVCRAEPGDALTATDGRGTIAALRLLSSRGTVTARVESVRSAKSRGFAVVACGAPEGQRADWLVEKLAELGIRILQPIETRRATWERFASRRDRLQRLTTAALRQSCQPWALELRDPVSLSEWLASLPGGEARWVADPEGEAATVLAGPGTALGAVGPAGGFDAAERSALDGAGFRRLRLAPGRLRAETAAVAWGALWAAGRSGDAETNP